jgi:hypothetical protein
MFYYFEEDYKPYMGGRVVVVRGDITDPASLREAMALDFQTVMNCAASVKHFASLDFLRHVFRLGWHRRARTKQTEVPVKAKGVSRKIHVTVAAGVLRVAAPALPVVCLSYHSISNHGW